ncbi:hypothetical protein Lumi_004 [Xylophilus phage Lumi]|nr:hypothetical protein Lumi_004 [Xylophilus phage Lumi]
MSHDDNMCELCHKPVLEGQARYTITGNHYDCHLAENPLFGKSPRELIEEIDKRQEQLKKSFDRVAEMMGMTPEILERERQARKVYEKSRRLY